MISTFKTDNLEVNPDVCRGINSRFQIGGLQWRWRCGRAGQAGQGWQCMGHPRLMRMGLFSSMLKTFCKNMWNMFQVENWIIEHIRYFQSVCTSKLFRFPAPLFRFLFFMVTIMCVYLLYVQELKGCVGLTSIKDSGMYVLLQLRYLLLTCVSSLCFC